MTTEGARIPDTPRAPAAVAVAGALLFVVVRTLVASSGNSDRFVLAGDLFADPRRAGIHVFPGADRPSAPEPGDETIDDGYGSNHTRWGRADQRATTFG